MSISDAIQTPEKQVLSTNDSSTNAVGDTPGSDAITIANADLASHNSAHRISALYANVAAAQHVRANLLRNGFAADAIEIRQHVEGVADDHTSVDSSDEVIKEVLTDSAIGAALGVGIGAIGTVVLITTSVTLFVASPLIAPLALIGNLATVGGLLGGAFGAADKETPFSAVVTEALAAGNVMLLVKTHNADENTLAKKIISDSLNGADAGDKQTQLVQEDEQRLV
ncbi:MAG TPA: hypothetical protein VIZ65_14870 [Cellvibrionaceae bacterium]